MGFKGGAKSAPVDPNTFFASVYLENPAIATFVHTRILVLGRPVDGLLRAVSPSQVERVIVKLVAVLVVHFSLNVVEACAHAVHDPMGLVVLPVNAHPAVVGIHPSSHAIKGPPAPSNGVPEPRRASAVNIEPLKKKI